MSMKILLLAAMAACAQARPAVPRSLEHVRYGETRELDAMLTSKELAVDTADAEGQTLLMRAATAGRSQVMRVLLARGANLETTDSLGRTALLHACGALKFAALSTLVELGANTGAKSTDGRDCMAWSLNSPLTPAALQTPALIAEIRAASLRQAGERAAANPVDEPNTERRERAYESSLGGFASISSVGRVADNTGAGPAYDAHLYMRGAGFERLYFGVSVSDRAFLAQFGARVWRSATVGFEGVSYKAYRNGATTSIAADELSSGGGSLMLGWAILTSRFVVHPYVTLGSGRLGQQSSSGASFGPRLGAGVFALFQLFRYPLGGLRAAVSVEARLGYSTYSSTIPGGSNDAFSQRTYQLGINPFEFRF